MDREVLVYVDLQSTPCLVGRLWARIRRERESATFEYDRGWLARPQRFSLEPALMPQSRRVCAVASGHREAANLGLSKGEIDRMASAFEHEDPTAARDGKAAATVGKSRRAR